MVVTFLYFLKGIALYILFGHPIEFNDLFINVFCFFVIVRYSPLSLHFVHGVYNYIRVFFVMGGNTVTSTMRSDRKYLGVQDGDSVGLCHGERVGVIAGN